MCLSAAVDFFLSGSGPCALLVLWLGWIPKSGDRRDSERRPAAYVPGQTKGFNESWRVFYEKWATVIRCFARQKGADEHSADDVLSLVMMKVLRAQLGQVAAYDPAVGKFKPWLWGVIRNCTREVLRDLKEQLQPPHSDGDDDPALRRETVLEDPEPVEELDERQWQKAVLAAALARVQARVTRDNFAVFTALLEGTASPEELARAHKKKANNIYQINARCLGMLKAEAKAIQQAWEHLGRLPA